ncbi:hypothetical protein D3C80_1687110 [compost metagenome]
MEALADLMRAELADLKGKPKRGRPRQKFKHLRQSPKMKAAFEVEDRVARGETYTKVRDEISKKRHIHKRDLERYGRIAKPMHATLLAIQQTMMPLNAITQAFADLARPFAILASQPLSPEGDSQEKGETVSPKNQSELLSSPE